jgi:hypothetical protein
MTVHQIANYATSRDYRRLAELAQQYSIICIVDRDGTHDVGQTLFSSSMSEKHWQVSSPGRCYVRASDIDDFVRRCQQVNLEFIVPLS